MALVVTSQRIREAGEAAELIVAWTVVHGTRAPWAAR